MQRKTVQDERILMMEHPQLRCGGKKVLSRARCLHGVAFERAERDLPWQRCQLATLLQVIGHQHLAARFSRNHSWFMIMQPTAMNAEMCHSVKLLANRVDRPAEPSFNEALVWRN